MLLVVAHASAFAGDAITRSMSFEACLASIQNLATQTGTAPVNIVETSVMRMVRFPAADGSMVVTCSAPDKKMIIQPSSKVCGVDVVC